MVQSGRRFLISITLTLLLLITACSRPESSRWDSVQQESQKEQITQTATAKPLAGGEFNRFFPETEAGYDRVYTQEKQGFAEAKLKQNGEEIAMLSVNDTAINPSAIAKFQNSGLEIAGYPAAPIGSTATAVLVGDRLQVKVQSRSESFSAADRQAWLEKFDLAGLAALASGQ